LPNCTTHSISDAQSASKTASFGKVRIASAGLVQVEILEAMSALIDQNRLWELIRADVAEAEFIEGAVSELMQSIHHVVMTAFEGLIDPGRLQYR
jgi:hypothetical protein